MWRGFFVVVVSAVFLVRFCSLALLLYRFHSRRDSTLACTPQAVSSVATTLVTLPQGKGSSAVLFLHLLLLCAL